MAYRIYLGGTYNGTGVTDGTLIHDLERGTDRLVATKAKIKYTASLTPDSLTFTLPATHPAGTLTRYSTIHVLQDTEEVFRGRISEKTRDFWNNWTYKCESDKAFLCDTIVRPFVFKGSITEFLNYMIENHNSMVDNDFRMFHLGNVTVTDENDYIARESQYAMSTLACLSEKLIDTLNGYIRIRCEVDHEYPRYYIDYLADFSENSGQVIKFGVNLLDLDETEDATTLCNCLIPYGKQLAQDDEGYTEPEPETGHIIYYSGNQTTIESVSAASGNDFVSNEDSVALYGKIWGTETWDDVEIPANLYTKSTNRVNNNTVSTTLKLTAVDMSMISDDFAKIRVGQYVECISAPHDKDGMLACTEYDVDLLDPEENTVELGTEIQSLTSSVSRSGSSASVSGSGNNNTTMLAGYATIKYGTTGDIEGTANYCDITFPRKFSSSATVVVFCQQVFDTLNLRQGKLLTDDDGNITGAHIIINNNFGSYSGERDFGWVAVCKT